MRSALKGTLQMLLKPQLLQVGPVKYGVRAVSSLSPTFLPSLVSKNRSDAGWPLNTKACRKRSLCTSHNVQEDDRSKVEKTETMEVNSQLYEDAADDLTLKLSDEELQKLTKGDEELIKKVRYIQLEHEMLRQQGYLVPTEPISLYRWQDLILLNTRSKRSKFFVFLFKLERTQENEVKRKEERRRAREEYLKSLPEMPPLGEDPDGMIYGLNRNTLTLRLRDNTTDSFYHNRLFRELQFGHQIVFDCSFDERMNQREQKNCASQIELCYASAKVHDTPYYLNLCGLNPESVMSRFLHRKMPLLCRSEYPVSYYEQGYLDLFPKERLVYLTPNAKDELREYNENDIYIIGALVDRENPKPYTFAKAKKENIRTAKLPLDSYVDWGIGSKELTLDQVLNIMMDFKKLKSWHGAFNSLPRRKLKRRESDEADGDEEGGFRRSTPRFVPPEVFLRREHRLVDDDRYTDRRRNQFRNEETYPERRNEQFSGNRERRSTYSHSDEERSRKDSRRGFDDSRDSQKLSVRVRDLLRDS